MENHLFDLIFSSLMMLIFFIPLIGKKKREENNFITLSGTTIVHGDVVGRDKITIN